LAEQLAAGPTGTFGAAKRLLLQSGDATLEEQLAREAETISAITATPDAREGILAFVEKRPPAFTGK
jgi:2-(1,2-epoxy-1,2-dihydrophenyl)acetyl-CoA isomerase